MNLTGNKLKEMMASDSLALAFGVREMRSNAVGLIAASAGYDCLFIDLEHGSLDEETVSQIAIAALGQQITTLVRCSKEAVHEGVRLLDNGVMGLVVPHVNSASEAEAIIVSTRYPPRGQRSLSSLLPQLRYETGEWVSLAPQIESEQLLFLMAETREAISNIDSIVDLEGFDGILLGASDLAADMGFLGRPAHEDVVSACLTVAGSCRRAGKFLAVGGVRDDTVIGRLIDAGARLVLCGADIAFMRTGAEAAANRVRGVAARSVSGY